MKATRSQAVTIANAEPTLLDKHKLLGAVINAPSSTSLDHKVMWHVIERYMTKHGNSRASLRYLGNATGAKLDNVTISLRRLASNGAISVIRPGQGTRPTEYALHLDFAKNPSAPVDGDTSSAPVGGDASAPAQGDTKAASVPADGDESLLRNPLTSGVTVRGNDAHAAPSAPPVAGLEASTADARDPAGFDAERFEELWDAFPRKQKRAEARDAYNALAPNIELHSQLVQKAMAWAECYLQRGTETQWQPYLHNWLKRERYHESIPTEYVDMKQAAIARAKNRRSSKMHHDAPEAAPIGRTGLSLGTPQGEHKVKVLSAEEFGDGIFEIAFRLTYEIEGGSHEGKKFSHEFTPVSGDEKAMESGQTVYRQVQRATGIEPAELTDLSGAIMRAVVGKMGQVRYEPA